VRAGPRLYPSAWTETLSLYIYAISAYIYIYIYAQRSWRVYDLIPRQRACWATSVSQRVDRNPTPLFLFVSVSHALFVCAVFRCRVSVSHKPRWDIHPHHIPPPPSREPRREGEGGGIHALPMRREGEGGGIPALYTHASRPRPHGSPSRLGVGKRPHPALALTRPYSCTKSNSCTKPNSNPTPVLDFLVHETLLLY
jgi:hypothetical protein